MRSVLPLPPQTLGSRRRSVGDPGSALTPVKMKLRSLIFASAPKRAATFAASASGRAVVG